MTRRRPRGLDEELVTRRLEAVLEDVRSEGWRLEVGELDTAEAPRVLARFFHDLVERSSEVYRAGAPRAKSRSSTSS